MHKSHLRSRVGCRNPALNAGSQVGSNFHLRWERWDPTTKGVVPPFPPGILGGIARIPPISRLTFYLGTSLTSSRAVWISTQVPTGPTTIPMFFLFVSFTLMFTIWSARFFINPVYIFWTLLTLTEIRYLVLCPFTLI